MRKSYRVKKEKDFQYVFVNGKSFANRQFVIYVINDLNHLSHFQVGISVGKKIGNSVARNWVKRRIRQTLMEIKNDVKPNCRFLVIARPSVSWMSMSNIRDHLLHVLKLSKVLIDDDINNKLNER